MAARKSRPKPQTKPKSSAPWMPVDYAKADVAALQAMKRGEATPDQQIRALEYIVGTVCDRNGMSFRPGPDGALEMAFAEGKRHVANQIVKFINTPLSKLKEDAPK